MACKRHKSEPPTCEMPLFNLIPADESITYWASCWTCYYPLPTGCLLSDNFFASPFFTRVQLKCKQQTLLDLITVHTGTFELSQIEWQSHCDICTKSALLLSSSNWKKQTQSNDSDGHSNFTRFLLPYASEMQVYTVFLWFNLNKMPFTRSVDDFQSFNVITVTMKHLIVKAASECTHKHMAIY